jgi:hypothetical protein
MTTLDVEPRAATPVPSGRGRWRLTVHRRVFAQPPCPTWDQTISIELTRARGRRITQAWNTPATLTFTLNGRDPAAAQVLELQSDVFAWRWDEAAGADICVGRFVITQSEDQITEQEHVVTFTGHDYLAMLDRRFELGATPRIIAVTDQDTIAAQTVAIGAGYGSGTAWKGFDPGALMPMVVVRVNPDGSARAALSGVVRDRNYAGGLSLLTELDDLAKVQGGFDYDIVPSPRAAALGAGAGADAVRIFYPAQGVQRADMVLAYGANVSTVTRTVTSADYANYVRMIGNKASADPNAAQLVGEANNADAAARVVGAWGLSENASDVSLAATVNQRAAGDLAIYGVLVPGYTLGLRPDRYLWGSPNMGDTVRMIVNSGRLNVSDFVRVVGITYDVGDDGTEDVSVTVGRPLVSIARLLGKSASAIDALARR